MIGKRFDPYGSYIFKVEIDNVISAGFSQVSGLSIEVAVESKKEGGVNHMEHHFPKNIQYPKLTLKRGMIDIDSLWKWYQDVLLGDIVRKNGSVCLYDDNGKQIRRWNFFNAYPTKWEGPSLNASSAAIATETFVIVHDQLKLAE